MSLASDDILLEPDLDDSRINFHTVLRAWHELRGNSVEVAASQSQETSIWEFAGNECIYFASINYYLSPPPQTKDSNGIGENSNLETSKSPLTMAGKSTTTPLALVTDDTSKTNNDEWVHEALYLHKEADILGESSASIGMRNPQTAPDNTSVPRAAETIGVIYITPSLFSGEVNLGLALVPNYRGEGLARKAVSLLLKWIFDEARYHRVQAALMAGSGRDTALRLFTGLGFAHEGTRRRQVFSAFSNEYKDVTCMTILDTEWSIRDYVHHTPNNRSRWDELFERHQREREELLEWEARHSKMKRTQSMETVRMVDLAETENNLSKGKDQMHWQDTGTSDTSEERQPSTNQKHVPDDWEDEGSQESPWGFPAIRSSPAVRWEVESDYAESIMSSEPHPDERHSESAASPPPPSESSNSSWWDMDSQDGRSSASWDNCESSSVAGST